jgi:hypothetical protein
MIHSPVETKLLRLCVMRNTLAVGNGAAQWAVRKV